MWKVSESLYLLQSINQSINQVRHKTIFFLGCLTGWVQFQDKCYMFNSMAKEWGVASVSSFTEGTLLLLITLTLIRNHRYDIGFHLGLLPRV